MRVDHSSKRMRGAEHGTEIVEAAIALPLVFLFIFAIIWIGLAFNAAGTLQRAARNASDVAAASSCALCGNNVATESQVAAAAIATLQADHLSPANLVSYSPAFACSTNPAPSCTALQNVQICRNVPLTCGVKPTLGVRVSFSYRFSLPIRMGSWQTVTIPAAAETPSDN